MTAPATTHETHDHVRSTEMYLASHQLAREHMRGLRDEAERANVARTVRVAQRLDRKARRAVLRASRAQADLRSLSL